MSKIPMNDFIIECLEEFKAENINLIDVSKLTTITDHMVICTGRASRHTQAMAEDLVVKVKQNDYCALPKVSGLQATDWVVIDLGDTIVHIMTAEMRQLYDLDSLWSFTDTESEAHQ